MIMQELNIRELKQQARQRMKQAVPHYAWMTLAYLALTTGLSSALDVAMGGDNTTAVEAEKLQRWLDRLTPEREKPE